MLTTHNPKDDDFGNGDTDDDNIFDNKDAFPDTDETFSLICDDVEFECKSDHKCIPIESYCDGQKDCDDESDESSCATTPAIHFSIVTTTVSTTTSTEKTTESTTEKLNTTTAKPTMPTTSTEIILNTTTSATTTTLKVLWNNFLRHTHCF